MMLHFVIIMGLIIQVALGAAPLGSSGKKPKPNTLITSKTMELDFSKPQMVSIHRGSVKVVDREIDLSCELMTVTFAKKNGKADLNRGKNVSPDPLLPAKNIGGKPKQDNVKTEAVPPMIGMGGNIETIVAEEKVVIFNKRDKTRAVGKMAVYTSATEKIVLTGEPVLYTENSEVKGKMIILDRRTNKLSVHQAIVNVTGGDGGKPKQTPPSVPQR